MDEIRYSIKELPIEDRPQEKLLKYGPESLSNKELLALIIRTGTKELTSVELSEKILYCLKREGEDDGLFALKNATLKELTDIKGIGEAKASMILAAVNLGIRMSTYSLYKKIKITSPDIAANYVMNDMKYLETEHFKIMNLNTKKEITHIREISHGSINMTLVYPREVFKKAISDNAHSIILLHNHPTGDPNPSIEDINLTNRLIECSKIIGIEILDHIIVGDNKYFSFLKEGLI